MKIDSDGAVPAADPGVPPGWQNHIDELMGAVRLQTHAPLNGDAGMSTAQLGYVRMLSLTAGPLRMSRSPRLVQAIPCDRVAVVIQQAGTAVLTQDGRSTTLLPRELAFVDCRRAFSLDQREPFQLLLAALPTHALAMPEVLVRQATGRPLPATGTAALLLAYIERLPSVVAQVPSRTADLLGGNTVEFAHLLIDELIGVDHRPPGQAREQLVPVIRKYIDAHLSDPDLTPERIAKVHHISVRYLHRLFEGEGVTVGRLIYQRRVEECGAELSRRGHASPTVSAVAARWGFRNPAHLSRAFKSVFGMTPRQWRLRNPALLQRGGAAPPTTPATRSAFPDAQPSGTSARLSPTDSYGRVEQLS
ncbi:helix-turn-helix domain-containing protein [Streptomyces sp. YS415]|uniref:helix-turn-helix domain-containing protein n=1 Tax=Streptomyces sp. YS415 TaxID=2944806 RepID=UPI0035AB823F